MDVFKQRSKAWIEQVKRGENGESTLETSGQTSKSR
jgi:hypothetical protein